MSLGSSLGAVRTQVQPNERQLSAPSQSAASRGFHDPLLHKGRGCTGHCWPNMATIVLDKLEEGWNTLGYLLPNVPHWDGFSSFLFWSPNRKWEESEGKLPSWTVVTGTFATIGGFTISSFFLVTTQKFWISHHFLPQWQWPARQKEQ